MVIWVRNTMQGYYQERFFAKAALERYKDKAKILYIEPKEEEILGLFLPKESLIFQNCVKETSASKRQNGTLMYQSQRT